MKLCEYTPAIKKACMSIFDSNVPFYFATQERETFQEFLEKPSPPHSYFVVRNTHERIVACGGIKIKLLEHCAWLRWDMVAREFHNQKIGTFLVVSRMHRICQVPEIHTINLCTSQRSYQFYEKMGFVVQKIVTDGIVPGIDEYFMELKLNEEKRQKLGSLAKNIP